MKETPKRKKETPFPVLGLGRFRCVPLLAAALGGLLWTSCTDFFSTSLGSWAARDRRNIVPSVNTGNVKDLVVKAENDPDLSLGVLKGIDAAVKKTSGQERISLQGAALEAAVNASGLGGSVLNKAGELSSVDSPEKARDMVVDAITGMKNLEETSTVLGSILPDPEADPEGFLAFTDAADPNDLAMAAAMLLAAEGEKYMDEDEEALEDYMDNFDPFGAGLSPSERLAVKLAEEAAKKSEGLNDSMKDRLDGLHLAPSSPGPEERYGKRTD
ncbi:MAG: hypothetical protein LBP32_02875, partial [Spirochaetaceae bacterium]|nr:hypothetical protein [Spirochaetaceae bacterium]